jgi:hypothetical protein
MCVGHPSHESRSVTRGYPVEGVVVGTGGNGRDSDGGGGGGGHGGGGT